MLKLLVSYANVSDLGLKVKSTDVCSLFVFNKQKVKKVKMQVHLFTDV